MKLTFRQLEVIRAVALHGGVTAAALELGVSQPAVSKHLAVLKRAGLVEDRVSGRQSHYSVRRDGLDPLVAWAREMEGFWQARFDALDDLLNRMDQ